MAEILSKLLPSYALDYPSTTIEEYLPANLTNNVTPWQLVKTTLNLGLNVFLLKYTATSANVISKGVLSPLDCIRYLLDGLSVDLCQKVLASQRTYRS
jgi:hypothetical protein